MKFIADTMLGSLARWLRTLGYDTLYFRGDDDQEMLDLADKEKRVILTRDTTFSRRLKDTPHLFITVNSPLEQLKEVAGAFNLKSDIGACFSRCLRCNGLLRYVKRNEVEDKVPEYIFCNHDEFKKCPDCGRIYWTGSHKTKMIEHLNAILNQP